MSTREEEVQIQFPQKGEDSSGLRRFWARYGDNLILLIGVALIALASFEAGYLEGRENREEPIKISQAACAPCPGPESGERAGVESGTVKQKEAEKNASSEEKNCAYAASKNSNKYHLATCQWTKRIKTENKICFSTEEEAKIRGYEGAKCCIK